MSRTLALLLLAVCALAAPRARAQTPVVARVETAAPAHAPFTLRATLPIPKGVFPRADGKSPFRVVDPRPGVAPVPAQVSIVSRYPTGEADVVELQARVGLPEDVHKGQRVTYDVLLDPVEVAGPPAVPAAVEELLAPSDPPRILLRTRDVYGHRYEVDLGGHAQHPGFGSARLLKSGPWSRQRRTYGTLVPVPPPAGAELDDAPDSDPLPHLMGVHAYLTEWAEEPFVHLDLRVNNGAISGSRPAHRLEEVLGIVYWRELELVLPEGWSAVPKVADPFVGEPYEEDGRSVLPLVRGNEDGSLHMMGPQAQFHRRLLLVPAGTEREHREQLLHAGLGFCIFRAGLWSWANAETGRYFPQRETLASYDWFREEGLGGKVAARIVENAARHEYEVALETGTAQGWYVESGVMGWAHPWFIQYQGGVGGEGISEVEGHRAAAGCSQGGITRLQLLHRMNACRQPEAMWDRFGDPVGYHAWLDEDGRIPFDYRLHGRVVVPAFRLPCKGGPPASRHVEAVVRRGLRPSYDEGEPFRPGAEEPGGADNLLAWWPHDDQHYVRWTKQPKALVWLADDALAKDDLILSAELYRLMHHESPHERASWSPGMTLRYWQQRVAEHPHEGLPLGRADAWGVDAMCAAYSVAGPEWRERQYPWFELVAQLWEDGAMPNGVVQRIVNDQLIGARYAVTQTFESLFLMHAMRCMTESVFRGVDDERRQRLERLALRGMDFLFFGPPFQRIPQGWQPDPSNPTLFESGPRKAVAVAPGESLDDPVYSDESAHGREHLPEDGLGGGVETFHVWHALHWAALVTDGVHGSGLENRYLRRALDCGGGHEDFPALLRALHEQGNDRWRTNSPNWIGLLGHLQRLGVR